MENKEIVSRCDGTGYSQYHHCATCTSIHSCQRNQYLDETINCLEEGIEVNLVDRKDLINLSTNGGYKQLAGLGIIQLASNVLKLDILKEPMENVINKFNLRKRNES